MVTKKFFLLFIATALLLGINACTKDDDDSSSASIATPAQLKEGIWSEYDEALLNSGKYTAEQLAQMPAVAMWIQGDKGYFFTYTAEDVSETVEGQISYNNKKGKGTITFPTIKDSPLSGQKVNFIMTTDESMEFEYTYEGKKTTGSCAWLCENLDNWSSDIDDDDWEEQMAFYQTIAAAEGPDASIDWGDLDAPLEWNEEAATRGGTRAIAIGAIIKKGLDIFSALFKEDPNEKINEKLDAILEKVDQVLANQQIMNMKLDEINGRLIGIANKLNQQETVNIFNNRNATYYNPLDGQNFKYLEDAYQLYTKNKGNLSQENKDKLGQYGKAWVSDGGVGEKYADLTWNYMKYITTVQHTSYGTGLDKIYDALTFDKYPWEHMGVGDRLNYRAYDLIMIAKSLFMIALYAQYGGLSDVQKEGIYKIFSGYTTQLLSFCEFSITNPDEFRVCQIPNAHFVMRREIQKYDYLKNNEAPAPGVYGHDANFMPKWHEAGSPKIENPEELKSKLIRQTEMSAIKNYYNPRGEDIKWMKMLVDGNNAAGAVYAKDPSSSSPELLLYNHIDRSSNGVLTMERDDQVALMMYGLMTSDVPGNSWRGIGFISGGRWTRVPPTDEFYLAIVEKRY